MMPNEKQLTQMMLESWKREINRAISRVKRPTCTELGKWLSREWCRAAAVSEWPEWRKRRYWEWRRRKREQPGTSVAGWR